MADELRRIELGIDGNAAFALLGEDIQSGECEFVDVVMKDDELMATSELIAAKRALAKLRARLNDPNYPYYFGSSHPYGT